MNKRPEWILPNLKKAQVRTKNTIERIDIYYSRKRKIYWKRKEILYFYIWLSGKRKRL